MKRRVLSGNEAFVRGALEAGIGFCASYPGTPATEIAANLMAVSKEHQLYVEWSVNEKVALEACAGASWMGVPALCSMKSLGLNVAADFLLNLNLSGSGPGGLILIVSDDPHGHSSSNEQDSRFYARESYLPLLEPSDFQMAKDIIPIALETSRKHEIPVIIRSTTRLSHSRGLVELGQIPERFWSLSKEFPDNLFNIPAPHLKHKDLLDKLEVVQDQFMHLEHNTLPEKNKDGLLVLTTGICSSYSREALDIIGFDKRFNFDLITTNPIPKQLVSKMFQDFEKILVVEEVDPFVEDILRVMASLSDQTPKIYGKRTGHIPSYGELNTDIVIDALSKIAHVQYEQRSHKLRNPIESASDLLVARPLAFCPGCTHRNFYWAIQKVRRRLGGKLIVSGDIGCYSLGIFYNRSMNSMHAMGSGIGAANGLGQLHRWGQDSKIVAVAGDSTFFHGCLPGLVNARHHNTDLTFVILDNRTTAMTGFQPHPGSYTEEETKKDVSIEKMVAAVEPDFLDRIDSEDIDTLIDRLHSTVNKKGLKVLIVESVCRLEEKKRTKGRQNYSVVEIDYSKCLGEDCRICVRDFGCTAMSWNNTKQVPEIVEDMCIRCGSCIPICPHGAIGGVEND